jgi:carbohydrate-binding DOMON domain-containing protein
MNSKHAILVVILAALIYAQGLFTVQSATDPTGDFKRPWVVHPALESRV